MQANLILISLILLPASLSSVVNGLPDVYKVKYVDPAFKTSCGFSGYLSVANKTCANAGPYVAPYDAKGASTLWYIALKFPDPFGSIVTFKAAATLLGCKGYLSLSSLAIDQSCETTEANMVKFYSGDEQNWILQPAISGAKNLFNIQNLERSNCPTADTLFLAASDNCENTEFISKGVSSLVQGQWQLLIQGGTKDTKTPKLSVVSLNNDVLAPSVKLKIDPPTFGELPPKYVVCHKVTSTSDKKTCATYNKNSSFQIEVELGCNEETVFSVYGIRRIGTTTPVAKTSVKIEC